MSASLTIADNLDGTGGVATVAGSGGADTNTLYRAGWTGQSGTLAWTLVGARTGDGTIAIAASAGHYLFRLANSDGDVAVVYQPLTNAAAKAILDAALDAVVLRIRGLNLSGISSGQISKRWLPRVTPADAFPMIHVTPFGGETFPGVMTATDDTGLPIATTIVDGQNQDPTANLSRNAFWRETILAALRYQRLAGVPAAYILVPEPGTIVNPAIFDAQNLFFSPLFFRLITRTPRG
jgi:hypothetical protein